MKYTEHVQKMLKHEHIDVHEIISSLTVATIFIMAAFIISIIFPSLAPILYIAYFLMAWPVMFVITLLGYSIVSWIIHRKD